VGGGADRDLPVTVLELGELLTTYPLNINDGGCESGDDFDDKGVFSRFEYLVYTDRDCGTYLSRHPDSIIDGRNFFNA